MASKDLSVETMDAEAAEAARSAGGRLRAFDRFVLGVDRSLHVVAAFWLFAIALLVMVDVAGRALGSPLRGTPEIIANSIVCIAFLQLSQSIRAGGMLRAGIIDRIAAPGVVRLGSVAGHLIGALVFLAVAASSWESMVEAWRYGEYAGEGGLRIPLFPVRALLVACSLLACLNFVLMCLRGEATHAEEPTV